jgi:cadmium resistance protein CadD (predicted permease)
VGLRIVGQAAAMFAVTNIDDIVILSLFFGRAAGRRADSFRIVLGQYVGFVAILLASVLGSLGAWLLPESVIPYLGLVPLLLGLRAAWRTWRESRGVAGHDDGGFSLTRGGTAVLTVAAVTLANGGDNIGVYVPVFATTDTSGLVTYCVVFLVMVGVWCAAGHFLATRPLVARALSRWGHHLLPVVLIGLGLVILLEGGVLTG